ncbi:MAG: hypothetical protein GXY03_11385 [Solirubrobacterales bacterium]|nr:hypothetical protein [Solirubrobacterales bacterium]
MSLLDDPEGGSLNDLVWTAKAVVKTYGGAGATIERGHEKLRREYTFLTELPPRAAAHFPRVLSYTDRWSPRRTALALERLPQRAIAKAILLGEHDPSRTVALCARAMDVLVADVYPLRSQSVPAREVWERHHLGRLRTALARLGAVPDIAPLLAVGELHVNGNACPGLSTVVDFIDAHSGRYFFDSRAVAAHGDTHLDNLLGSSFGPLTVRLIDPRGDLHLEPSYDFAKLLKAARTLYDPIHYGYREVTVTERRGIRVDLTVETKWNAHYVALLALLHDRAAEYADLQGLSVPEFWRTALATEFAHVVSFAFYHAHRPRSRDLDRVRAYIAVAALLGRQLMLTGPDQIPDTRRTVL